MAHHWKSWLIRYCLQYSIFNTIQYLSWVIYTDITYLNQYNTPGKQWVILIVSLELCTGSFVYDHSNKISKVGFLFNRTIYLNISSSHDSITYVFLSGCRALQMSFTLTSFYQKTLLKQANPPMSISALGCKR